MGEFIHCHNHVSGWTESPPQSSDCTTRPPSEVLRRATYSATYFHSGEPSWLSVYFARRAIVDRILISGFASHSSTVQTCAPFHNAPFARRHFPRARTGREPSQSLGLTAESWPRAAVVHERRRRGSSPLPSSAQQRPSYPMLPSGSLTSPVALLRSYPLAMPDRRPPRPPPRAFYKLARRRQPRPAKQAQPAPPSRRPCPRRSVRAWQPVTARRRASAAVRQRAPAEARQQHRPRLNPPPSRRAQRWLHRPVSPGQRRRQRRRAAPQP